jgi:hypothetical protein
MAQLIAYQVMGDNPEFTDILMNGNYLNSHIADRITTNIMTTEAYAK